MEGLNHMCNKKKERNLNLFNAPPYCQKNTSTLPFIDDCLKIPLRLEVSDASKIMYFLENLNGITTKELEIDINCYLKSMCEATDVFIIHLLRISGQGKVQMLNDEILEQEVIMPLSYRILSSIIKYDGKNYYCSNELHPDIKKICRKVMGRKDDKLNVIPILSRCRRDKDETLNIHGNPVALICLLNCERMNFYVLKATQELFRYCTTTLLNTMEGEEEAKLKKNCHLLLEGTKNLFKNIHDLNQLIREIMTNMKILTNSERCCLFLIDPEQLNWVQRAFSPEPENGVFEVRITADQAIAAHVAATGRALIITNAYEHPLFNKLDDHVARSKTRNILCFPIRNEKELLIGVGQLINKKNGQYDIFDEQIIEAFSNNCGISFMHALLYKKLEETVLRTRLAQEIMVYKLRVTYEDIAQVLCCKTVHRIPYFDLVEFLTRSIVLPETICYVLRMFDDLDYLKTFKIRDLVLIKFFLMIKSAYRENPYRNWAHGFATGHFMYSLLKNLKLVEKKFISPLEGLALLISAFCHDVDYVGLTNPYLLKTKSLLANFYTSEYCIKARHSLNQTLTILNLENCNILEGLSNEDYNVCVELIKDLILSSDLSVHLKLKFKQKQICTELYQNVNPAHRYYLCSLLMTASDLSDYAKDWINTKRVIWYILEEFFKFGDLEKEFERTPIKGMDRNDFKLCEVYPQFLEEICLPVFNILTTLFPDVEILKIHLLENIETWKKLFDFFFEKETDHGMKQLDILLDDELDKEAEEIRQGIQDENDDGGSKDDDNDEDDDDDEEKLRDDEELSEKTNEDEFEHHRNEDTSN